jgi:hypothetical protein
MAGTEMKNTLLIGLVVLVIIFVIYQYDPSFFGLFVREGFVDSAHGTKPPGLSDTPGSTQKRLIERAASVSQQPPSGAATAGTPYTKEPQLDKKEGFADLSAYEGPASFGTAEAPAGCYPRDQLTPSELLPRDMNSIWAEQNPMGPGSLKGKNFLSAGALIGVNTVGQSLRNANLQVRSEPPNPQVAISIFNQSTISPDISHRPLEIGG